VFIPAMSVQLSRAMVMKIDERFLIEAPIDAVGAFIRNPQTVAPCIPGCEAVEPISDKLYRSTIGVALGPIRARFNVVVEITEELAPNRLVCLTKGEEGGKASMITATTEIKFEAQESGRREISSASEISIVGRLGNFGLGIMKKRAEQLASEFAAVVQQRMQTTDA
jgi:carbon monoxide dehydrogenase subunit G